MSPADNINPNKKRILVVDDDKSIVKILRGYLEQAGYQVFAAYSGQSAMDMLFAERPDLLILDLMLPDRDGYDITKVVRSDRRLAATPIIMLTARVDDIDKILGLEMGADDYITKPFNAREVMARVRSLLRRVHLENAPPSHIITLGDLLLDSSKRELTLNQAVIDLTPTEYKLILLMMDSPGHTFTRDELLEKSVGYAYEGMGRTLDTHILNLRKKIEVDARTPRYIQTVYGIGYRMVA